jgi:hypothetical protein
MQELEGNVCKRVQLNPVNQLTRRCYASKGKKSC